MNRKGDLFHWILCLIVIILVALLAIIFLVSKPMDTDKDGLSDEEELNLGTNLTNPNTDGDRYLDGEDPSPLEVNSAKIEYYKINERGDYHAITITKDSIILAAYSAQLLGCGSSTFGTCVSKSIPLFNSLEETLDDTIHTSSGEIVLSNIGDDYSEYVNLDVIFTIGDTVLYTAPVQKGKILPNQKIIIPYNYDFKVKDVKYIVWDMIIKKEKMDVNIENLQYEKW